MAHPVAERLDTLMIILFSYIKDLCHVDGKTSNFRNFKQSKALLHYRSWCPILICCLYQISFDRPFMFFNCDPYSIYMFTLAIPFDTSHMCKGGFLHQHHTLTKMDECEMCLLLALPYMWGSSNKRAVIAVWAIILISNQRSWPLHWDK